MSNLHDATTSLRGSWVKIFTWGVISGFENINQFKVQCCREWI
jgi:hypothetical protein